MLKNKKERHLNIRFLFYILSLSIGHLTFAQSIYKNGIITGVKTKSKIIALTFDACETVTPAYFDKSILSTLINNKVPATIFLSGKFALRNRNEIKDLTKYSFLSFGNHSMNHFQHTEKLSPAKIQAEVQQNDSLIYTLTGKHTAYFRFPAGNYNNTAVNIIKKLGFSVVHWSFASGDPVKTVPAEQLLSYVKGKIKPGCILIFHINGRGYKTGAILPDLLKYLKEKGYSFVSLDYLLLTP